MNEVFGCLPVEDNEYKIHVITPTAPKKYQQLGLRVEVHGAMSIVCTHNYHNETGYIIGVYCDGVFTENATQCPDKEMALIQPFLKSLIDNGFSKEKLQELSKCSSVKKTIKCEHNISRCVSVTHIHNMAVIHILWSGIIAGVTNDGHVFKIKSAYKLQDEIDSLLDPDIINDISKLKKLGYS